MKAGSRKAEAAKKHALALPVALSPSRIHSLLAFLGLSLTRIDNPHCEGIFDPRTRSVWVSSSDNAVLLWRRGFFGKGDLSRSEPSWHTRRLKSNAKRVQKQWTRSLLV